MRRRSLLALGLPLGGPAGGAGATGPLRPAAAGESALAALRELFEAASAADPLAFARLLDDTSPAYLALHKALVQLTAAQDQIHYHLSETSIVVDGDFAEARTRWERRALARAPRQPLFRAGTAVLQFSRTGGPWRLRSVGGDNPFAISTQRHS